ncbi:hypothetical protein GGE07_002613 [Sinorhizobium terangae]|nr:hypothetical protein [Sinorhizobium terangae]
MPERVAHDPVGILRKFICRDEIVRLVEIEGRDVGDADELNQFQGLLCLELDRIHLLRFEENVFVVLVFVALDDIVDVDGPDAFHHLLVVDRLARRFMDLAE